mmetsp:Transcript_8352/g.11685  ORF Transcript_8352/g.11685 Transcript_8352/m.11685 type:complete len:164 (+) Transcript_8352:120-611(+)
MPCSEARWDTMQLSILGSFVGSTARFGSSTRSRLSVIALWAISGVVAYVGCWLFYRDYFQQWTNQIISYTVFTFNALVCGDLAKSVGRYFRKPHAPTPPRAVPQEATIEEELGLLMEEEVEEVKKPTGILTEEENRNVIEVDINFCAMPNEDEVETALAIKIN